MKEGLPMSVEHPTQWALTNMAAMKSVRWGLTREAAETLLAELDGGDGQLQITPQKWNGMCNMIGGSKDFEAHQRGQEGSA
jgi:hypothetical protein